MTQCSADFEAGTNGNNVTTGAGEASATAWDVVQSSGGGAATYDTTHAAHGTLAAKLQVGQNKSVQLGWKAALGTVTDHYGRFYIYRTAFPVEEVNAMNLWATGFGILGYLRLGADGKFVFWDSSQTPKATMTTAMALDAWVRLEYHANNGTGQFEMKLFNTADSGTPTETQTSAAGLNFGGSTDEIRFGGFEATSGGDVSLWLDDIVVGAGGYPGPAAALASYYTILNGSDEALSNVNAGGTDIDAATYKNAVSLTEAELATLLDGTSFGKKNVAVLPDLTGVADARQIKKTTFSAETESS